MLKILEKEDVKEVFCNLLENNGEVTSKEVKDELRNRGFWAIQAQVSWFIKSNYKDWGGYFYIIMANLMCIFLKMLKKMMKIPVTNNIASVSIDVDEEDDNDSTSNQGKKCRITTMKRFSDDEIHIDVFSPKENTNVNVIVNRFDFDEAQYIISYNKDVICFVGSKDTTLTNKQARYYAWKVYKDEYPGMEYFDVRCNKFF